MTPDMFDFFSKFLRERSGLALQKEKQYLLENRLASVVRSCQLDDEKTLYDMVRSDPNNQLANLVVEAMSVTETSFFRDSTPFDLFLKRALPEILDNRPYGTPIRIWSAAASSGQEAYTLAILCRENADLLAGHRLEIVATDISTQVLEKARAGVYSQFEVQRGMPVKMLLKYFDQSGDLWRLRPEIKSMVNFQQFNLMSPFVGFQQYDIVLCRNVLIYFDVETKKSVLEKIRKVVAPDGFLMLGGAETVVGLSDHFVVDEKDRMIFRPNDTAAHGNASTQSEFAASA